jgi:beta-lactamase class A
MPAAATEGSAAGADPRRLSDRLLREYAREPGRSAFVRVATATATWEGGIAADEPHPAASLLKVPLALAAERAFAVGDLDPDATVAVERLETAGRGPEPLRVLRPGLLLSATDVLGLCLALSDRACATWLLDAVGIAAVRDVVGSLGCRATSVSADRHAPGAPLVGRTTARDALRLLAASQDAARYPITTHALRNTFHNSRIPLGATGLDVRIAHKTGSLAGVANDVAVLDCTEGTLLLAYLSEGQHDTLVSGYEMGICTRGLLRAWGLAVTRSGSVG